MMDYDTERKLISFLENNEIEREKILFQIHKQEIRDMLQTLLDNADIEVTSIEDVVRIIELKELLQKN